MLQKIYKEVSYLLELNTQQAKVSVPSIHMDDRFVIQNNQIKGKARLK